jgi:hypothetical protein
MFDTQAAPPPPPLAVIVSKTEFSPDRPLKPFVDCPGAPPPIVTVLFPIVIKRLD